MRTYLTLSFCIVSLFATAVTGCSPKSSPTQAGSQADTPSGVSGADPSQQAGDGGGGSTTVIKKAPHWNWPSETSASSRVSEGSRKLVSELAAEETMDRFSLSSYVLLGRGVKERFSLEGKINFYSGALAFKAVTPEPDDVSSSLADARQQYLSIKDNYEFGHKLLAANNRLVKTALRAGTAVATASGVGTLGGLALGAVSQASSAGLNKVLKIYDDSATEAAQRYLSLKLRDLPQAAWKDWDNLPNLSPDEARAFVAKQVHDWSSAIGAEGDSSDTRAVRASFDSYLVRATTAQLAKEQSLRELADRQINSSLQETSGQITAISKALIGFSRQTQEQITSIQQTQKEIKSGIDKIQGGIESAEAEIHAVGDSVREISHSIGFVNEFVFGRMNPGEQIRALKGGMFPGLDDSKRRDLEDKIDLVEKRRSLEVKTVEFLSGAQTLIGLGAKLGVNPELLNTAQKAVSVGQTMATVFSTLTSGTGYLGAVEAIGSLFGMSGPDLAEQRHEEIMNHLNALAAGQQAILQGEQAILDGQKVLAENQKVLLSYSQAILDNQKLMIENQKNLYNGLVQVSDQVHAYHLEVMEKFDRMHTDILFSREMIRLVASKNVLMCNNFLASRIESDGFDLKLGQFANFSGLRSHFNEYAREFFSCMDGLEELIGNRDLSKVFLSSEAFKQTGNGVDAFINTVFKPTIGLMKAGNSKDSPVWVGLSLPSERSSGVATKCGELKDRKDLTPTYDLSLLDEPVAVDALEKYVSYLIEVYPYFDLVSYDRGGGLDDVQTILGRTDSSLRRKKAALLLKRALALVNLAIAQETIVSGDALLEKIYVDGFDSADCNDNKGRFKAFCVLQGNPVLAQNFVLYGLKKDLAVTKNNLMVYDVARALANDPRLLKQITVKPWSFAWTDNKWVIKFGERSVPIPSSAQVFDERIEYRSEMGRLIQLRSDIAGILSEADLGVNMESNGKRNLYFMLLKGI